MDAKVDKQKVMPLSLEDAPSLIERIWPAQQISVEVQKERKAGQGQTLTGLGSYWKGRKPLFLVEACVLGALLPASGDDAKDLETFELLLGMHDSQLIDRMKSGLSLKEIKQYGTPALAQALIEVFEEDGKQAERLRRMPVAERNLLMAEIYRRMPYTERVSSLLRPEEVAADTLVGGRLDDVNEHLGTQASTLADLVDQLGQMRFGHTPRVADTFCGGGSIPYAAARLGCNVYASDLNPVAAMLTWGSLNIVGSADVSELTLAQDRLAKAVDDEIVSLGIEHDESGNRAKAYLYCLEARCPQTQWLVPMLPSLIISKRRKVVARLVPDPKCLSEEYLNHMNHL